MSWWTAPAKDSSKPGPSGSMISTRSLRCTSSSANTAATAAARSISRGKLKGSAFASRLAPSARAAACRACGLVAEEEERAVPAPKFPAGQCLPADSLPVRAHHRVSPLRNGPVAWRWPDLHRPARRSRTRTSLRRDQLLILVMSRTPPQGADQPGGGVCQHN